MLPLICHRLYITPWTGTLHKACDMGFLPCSGSHLVSFSLSSWHPLSKTLRLSVWSFSFLAWFHIVWLHRYASCQFQFSNSIWSLSFTSISFMMGSSASVLCSHFCTLRVFRDRLFLSFGNQWSWDILSLWSWDILSLWMRNTAVRTIFEWEIQTKWKGNLWQH